MSIRDVPDNEWRVATPIGGKVKKSDGPSGAECAWVNTLPIAAAVFAADHGKIWQVAANGRFLMLETRFPGETGLSAPAFAGHIEHLLHTGRSSHVEKWSCSRKSNPCHLDINIAALDDRQNLFLVSVVGRNSDLQDGNGYQQEIAQDQLTGFFNRIGFEHAVQDALADMNGEPVSGEYAIILLDILRFGRVNEMAGAQSGDELIRMVARKMKARVRPGQILGRMGNNEFALFMKMDGDGHYLDHMARRLRTIFDEPFILSSVEIDMDCAVAGAVGTVEEDKYQEVAEQAQIALKKAKISNRFEIYSDDDMADIRLRSSMESDLRLALKRGELSLYYQPLIDLVSGRVTGFEALSRWDHPVLGPVSPTQFIPIAEESGLIVPLGRWVLEEALRTISEWDRRSDGLPYHIAVNMSAVQLSRDDIVDMVKGSIETAGVQGNRLTIELTESAFISDPENARGMLDQLKGLQVNIAMDDFGTGYSNFGYLQQLPIDVLKIDRSFISDMMQDGDKRAIVKTLLSLARALNIQVTAEGVESVEVSAELRTLGCSVAQGFYYARPLNRADAYQFLLDNFASTSA